MHVFNPGRPPGHTHRGYPCVFLLPGLKHCGQDSGSVWHDDTSCTEKASPDLSSHRGDPKEQRKGDIMYEGSVPFTQPH